MWIHEKISDSKGKVLIIINNWYLLYTFKELSNSMVPEAEGSSPHSQEPANDP